MEALIAIPRARLLGGKCRRGSSLVEVSMAMVILMVVAYVTCLQDTLSLSQVAYDAQHAVAKAYIENEAARVRASFNTNDPASYLTNYPTSMGVTNSITNIPLGGSMAIANSRCPYTGNVYRSLVSQIVGNEGMAYNRYEVVVQIPYLKGRTMTNETITRDIDRVFAK